LFRILDQAHYIFTKDISHLMVYGRHGQSAARGPHAARETFFVALEIKGAQNFCKITPKNAIFEENFYFLSQKMTFLKNIFGASWDFHKSAEKFSKNFAPLYPLE
jgi:hypothetical protein